MSYSYSPAPVANRSTHWQSQQQWASAQGRAFSKVFAQLWCDTYYYHYYNGSDIEVRTRKQLCLCSSSSPAHIPTLYVCMYFPPLQLQLLPARMVTSRSYVGAMLLYQSERVS